MPVKLEDHPFRLEEKFWTGGADYYRRNLAYAAIMVFPDPAGVMVKDEIASSLARNEPWSQVARASSAYVRDGSAWKLAFHQQTPV